MNKNHTKRIVALLLMMSWFGSAPANAEECDGSYFTIDDSGQEFPVKFPTRKLAETLRKAKAGVSVEQRNLAISYEAGYLVSRCHEKAVYWYGKAAESGDETAKQWSVKNKAFEALHAGPECAEESCPGSMAAENRVAVLYSDSNKNGHYFAPLTINGRTARGLIDTGASTIAMSVEMAKTFGINTSEGKLGQSSTANGQITTSRLTLPLIEVAGIKLRNVPVSIGISDGILIGMSFLNRVNVSMNSGILTMTKK